jgi:hypothetical protein
MRIRCACGFVEIQLTDEPMTQYVCHCNDCRAVHGKAYSVALYAAAAVAITHGETCASTLKTILEPSVAAAGLIFLPKCRAIHCAE